MKLSKNLFGVRNASMFALVVGLSTLGLAGCSSDANAICQFADDCNTLTGISVDECSENIEKSSLTDSQLSDCANCIDGKSCSTVGNGDCNAACSVVFTAAATPGGGGSGGNNSTGSGNNSTGSGNNNSSGSGPEGPSNGG